MNICVFAGRLCQETKVLQSGMISNTLAVRQSKKKDAETMFIQLLISEKLAGITQYLVKGGTVTVSGRLATPSTYAKRDGTTGVNLTLFVNEIELQGEKQSNNKPKENNDDEVEIDGF